MRNKGWGTYPGEGQCREQTRGDPCAAEGQLGDEGGPGGVEREIQVSQAAWKAGRGRCQCLLNLTTQRFLGKLVTVGTQSQAAETEEVQTGHYKGQDRAGLSSEREFGARRETEVKAVSAGWPHLGNRTQSVLARLPASEPIFPKVAQSIHRGLQWPEAWEALGWQHFSGIVPGTPRHPGLTLALLTGNLPANACWGSWSTLREPPGNHSL